MDKGMHDKMKQLDDWTIRFSDELVKRVGKDETDAIYAEGCQEDKIADGANAMCMKTHNDLLSLFESSRPVSLRLKSEPWPSSTISRTCVERLPATAAVEEAKTK